MFTKDNTYKVLRIFFDYPEKKFHIRETARLTKLSPAGVIKIIDKLKKEGFLISEKEKMVENVSATRNERFVMFKRFYNIAALFDSGLIDFLKEKYEEPETIILFGNYSRGEDISTNDIDIAVITKKSLQLDVVKYEKILKRKIDIFEFKAPKKEYLNSLANGIVLFGHLKIIENQKIK